MFFALLISGSRITNYQKIGKMEKNYLKNLDSVRCNRFQTILISINAAKKTTFHDKFCDPKKVGFSQKWGSSEHFCWNFLSPVGNRPSNFMKSVILKHPPLVFPQIAKNWISKRKSKMTKVCFRTFPDLWRHSYFFSVPHFEIDLSH